MSFSMAVVDERPAETCLARAGWQPVIFATDLQRARLLGLRAAWPCRPLSLHVQRNQPFEFVASVLSPFLAYAGWKAEVSYSDYDDSLSFAADPSHHVQLVWLDFGRYQERLAPSELAQWLHERLARLRASTGAAILVTDWAGHGPGPAEFNRLLEGMAVDLPGVHICPQSAIGGMLGAAYHDARTARITGMTMSDAACLHTARQLGLAWLPAVLEPRIKAVVVDLDGTLYRGVLGEDGSSGIEVSSEHQELQRSLLALREQGLLLAVASRNDPQDVQEMFATRADLVVRPEHFSAMAVSWGSKAEAVHALAHRLRIGPDSMLFVDDNPGELAEVASQTNVRCLHAAEPAVTSRALELFPGIFTFTHTTADELRFHDLAVAAKREEIKGRMQDDEYLRSLGVRLGFSMGAAADPARLHELSIKTNQFNTALRRLSEAEVATYLSDPQRRAVAISLRDRLSDSGVVGAVFAHRRGDVTVIDEIAISCRALGRRLEHLMIAEALRGVMAELPAREIAFSFTAGPRNQPAGEWLSSAAGGAEPVSGLVVQEFDSKKVADLVASAAIEVAWEHPS